MNDVSVTGTVQLVDTFLRPVALIVVTAIGLLVGVLLAWFAWWWWVPIPLAAMLLSTELFFYSRGDRAEQLVLKEGHLVLLDPLADGGKAIDLSKVTVATRFHRALPMGETEVVFVLGDHEDVRLAFRLIQRVPLEPSKYDVPADVLDVLFGGIAGLFRALAPDDRRPRQSFSQPDGAFTAALMRAIPKDAFTRTGIRLWKGMEPELDLFGYHVEPHTGWLVLDGHDWIRFQGPNGSIRGWRLEQAEREVTLFVGIGEQASERMPLALVNLGSNTTVAMPAPSAADIGEGQALTSDLLHTHAPEGAALVWHLVNHTPRDRWPEVLHRMVRDRRAIREDLDAALPA